MHMGVDKSMETHCMHYFEFWVWDLWGLGVEILLVLRGGGRVNIGTSVRSPTPPEAPVRKVRFVKALIRV